MATGDAVRGQVRGRRALVAVLAAVVAALSAGDGAQASLVATAGGVQPIATGRWSAVISAAPPTAATTGAPTTSLAADSFWWIGNNGSVALDNRFTVRITVTTTGGATAQLEDCSGAAAMRTNNWNETTGACNGIRSVIASSGTTAIYVLPASYPVGAAVRLRLRVTSPAAGATATLGVTVSW